jgi:hypothetical protein
MVLHHVSWPGSAPIHSLLAAAGSGKESATKPLDGATAGKQERFHSPLFVPTSQGERQRRRHRGASVGVRQG